VIVHAVRGHEGEPRVVEIDEPPGRGEVITMRAAGICASDLGYLALGTDKILGHELAGMRADGTPVAVEGLFGCGVCDYCRSGRNNLCHQSAQMALGIMQDGGMAEQFRVPTEKLVELPAGLDLSDAALVEPTSVAWHGVRVGGTSEDSTVAVVGGGSIGQLAAASAQRQGAAEVALEARYSHQHAIRERLGVGEPHDRYDIVIEAAGSPSAIQRCVELVKPGGTVVVLGVVRGPLDIPFPSLLTKEVRLVASMGYCGHPGSREMRHAAEMLAARPEIGASLITHRFPLEDAAEAFRVAADRESGAIKVAVDIISP
jgi:2-desacetyl-2-hydroxyethyl bacteriochlorophyllide A dehydrogenase